jgi:hypothetical protein
MTTPGFHTTDLNLAAYLITLGHPLTRVDGLPGQRRTFHFPPTAVPDTASFYQHGIVPARAFANALRDLKTRIRS